MCRACSDPSGGRRCPQTESAREAGKAASTRYYKRGKARLLIAQLADLGIRATDDSGMPPTYHLAHSGETVDLEEEHGDIQNWAIGSGGIPGKPSGALWSSPGRVDDSGNVKTAWTDWSARQGYADENGDGGREVKGALTRLQAQPGAVVAVISTPDDAVRLSERYGLEEDNGEKHLDWVAMRRDGIDGVHVTESLAHESKKVAPSHPASQFSGWDAGSTAWLSTERLEASGEGSPGVYDDDDDGAQGDSYKEPNTPQIEGAWDRVPKKVRESKAAERGLAPGTGTRAEGDSETGAEGEPGGSSRRSRRGVKVPKPKEYTEAVPPSYGGLLDAGREGAELLRVLMDKQGDGERRGQPSSR